MKAGCLGMILVMFLVASTSAQKLGDRIERKIKARVDRKIDKTIDKGLDKAEKGIEDGVKKDDNKNEGSTVVKQTVNKRPVAGEDTTNNESAEPAQEIEAYTKFDFVPGSSVMFIDDFSRDSIGDFPSKWNTNGAGEVVLAPDRSSRWFELKGSSVYIPSVAKKLPEEYTLEFDLTTSGVSRATSSTANLHILLDDNDKFTKGKNFAWIRIYLTQYTDVGVKVTNKVSGAEVIDNTLKLDIRKKIIEGTHISVAVNKKRFRLWADDRKLVDIPTLVPAGAQQLKFALEGFAKDFETAHVYISNVKIAAGGVDLRSKLITEGKLSTTAITFNVNSDKLKPESMGIIKEIAGVLEASPDVKIKIFGHTDADGDEARNLELSKKRALAVKNALVEVYRIKSDRIQTDGKGESVPSAPNNTAEGKAANRRVEFIKT